MDPHQRDLTSGWARLGEALLELEVARREDSAVGQAEAQVSSAEEEYAAALEDLETPFAGVVLGADLSPTEARVLAVCAAIEMDRRLQRLVAVLTGDAHQHRADLDLLVRLLGPESVAAVADDAGLRRAALVDLDPQATFAAAQVTVHHRVLWALRGDLSLDPDLPLGTDLVVLPPTMIGSLDLVLVHGEDRVRRTQAAMAALGPSAFLDTTAPTDQEGWRCLVRMASVGGLGVVLDLPDGITPLTKHWVDRAEHVAFALCTRHQPDLDTAPVRPFVELAAGAPPVEDHEWARVFPDAPPPARRPTAEQLHAARLISSVADGQEVLRRVASGTLLAHATRVVPRATRDDLILPDLQARQLQALLDRYRQRSKVHEEWGLSLYPSPGVVALFSGPSGTGKTTSAEVLAHELGVEMFRVDLSALVSKYIGETEKNLEQIFSAAHTGNYLLLFDEADSLFGSRSKVTDSKDRYANLEVSYLLQRLETYDGFVVLTSNFQGNIDPAFLRRIHATVHFALPTGPDRVRIWERSLGKAPVAEVDLTFVAEQFDLSGGSIRNAALSAAFAAAAADRAIEMPDLLRAVAAEMTKLGRRPNDAQFGRWLGAVTHP